MKIFKNIVSLKKKSDFFKENTKYVLVALKIIYEQRPNNLISGLSF